MNKGFKRLAVGLLATLLLAGCGQKNEQAKVEDSQTETSETLSEEEAWKLEPAYGKPLKIGYNGGLCTGGPGIATVLGLFEEKGIETEIIQIQSKVDSIGTGQVDLTTDHIASLLVPSVNGVDMKFKMGAHTGCKSLFVLEDGEINSTEDLKGKKIGLPDGIGNSDHNIALRFLNNDNIDPDEITFVPIEGSASILALENGEIDGAVLSDQFAEGFEEDGTIKMIRSLTWDEDFKQEPCCVYAFNGTFLEENPITAKKVTEVLFEASEWIANNTEEATQILFDNDWASGDFDQAVRMMKSYGWEVTNEMTETTLRNILDDYKRFDVITLDEETDVLLEEVWKPEAFNFSAKADNEG